MMECEPNISGTQPMNCLRYVFQFKRFIIRYNAFNMIMFLNFVIVAQIFSLSYSPFRGKTKIKDWLLYVRNWKPLL